MAPSFRCASLVIRISCVCCLNPLSTRCVFLPWPCLRSVAYCLVSTYFGWSHLSIHPIISSTSTAMSSCCSSHCGMPSIVCLYPLLSCPVTPNPTWCALPRRLFVLTPSLVYSCGLVPTRVPSRADPCPRGLAAETPRLRKVHRPVCRCEVKSLNVFAPCMDDCFPDSIWFPRLLSFVRNVWFGLVWMAARRGARLLLLIVLMHQTEQLKASFGLVSVEVEARAGGVTEGTGRLNDLLVAGWCSALCSLCLPSNRASVA